MLKLWTEVEGPLRGIPEEGRKLKDPSLILEGLWETQSEYTKVTHK